MENLVIRRYESVDLPKLLALSRDIYGDILNISNIEQKFDTSYSGHDIIGYVALDGDVLAAFYGVFPCVLHVDGHLVLGAQSGDTVTNASYRGRGLFIELAKLTYEAAKKEGIKVVYGFPSPSSLPGFKKHLNWIIQGESKAIKLPGIGLLNVFERCSDHIKALNITSSSAAKAGTLNSLTSEFLTYKSISAGKESDALLKIASGKIRIGWINRDLSLFYNFLLFLKIIGYALLHKIEWIEFYADRKHPIFRIFPFSYTSIPFGYVILDHNLCMPQEINFQYIDFDTY